MTVIEIVRRAAEHRKSTGTAPAAIVMSDAGIRSLFADVQSDTPRTPDEVCLLSGWTPGDSPAVAPPGDFAARVCGIDVYRDKSLAAGSWRFV